jgi:ankyrin repeat protein
MLGPFTTRRAIVASACAAALTVCASAASIDAAPTSVKDALVADAAERRDREQVRALLTRGTDANAPQADGSTALHWAAHWNDLDLADILLRHRGDPNRATDLGVAPLFLACGNGGTQMVQKLLGAGADARAALPSGETALMACAKAGSLEAVDALLAKKADPNAHVADTHAQTAVMWAAAEGHGAIVARLIAAGADPNARTKTGLTPLFFAARRGDLASAEALVQGGATIDPTSPDGSTPLLMAAASLDAIAASDYRLVPSASGHERVAIMLLERGANHAMADKLGMTALHAAVDTDKTELVASLIRHKANLDARFTKGLPFRRGDYVGRAYYVGATPLWLAAKDGKLELMRVLADAGADTRLGTEGGITPLMVAAGLGQTDSRMPPESKMLEAVRYLVGRGGDVNERSRNGQTAVHGAANVSFDTVIAFLAERGANVNAKDNNGRTPFDLTLNPMRPRPKTGDTLRTLGALTEAGVQ